MILPKYSKVGPYFVVLYIVLTLTAYILCHASFHNHVSKVHIRVSIILFFFFFLSVDMYRLFTLLCYAHLCCTAAALISPVLSYLEELCLPFHYSYILHCSVEPPKFIILLIQMP